ncbi:splice [Stylonychia lemnae]|uniref:Splice n=1 Tax=Stylonychia lemnae TaxID=5949 RepID=A0A078AVD5_STYLE|nr:splice [Stylonychia lemnae]|eukprot:CDW84793.1 splice [Stylonychia lemnae]
MQNQTSPCDYNHSSINVRNFPMTWSKADLESIFRISGEITDVNIIGERGQQGWRDFTKFAIICFKDIQSSQRAISKWHGSEVQGDKLVVYDFKCYQKYSEEQRQLRYQNQSLTQKPQIINKSGEAKNFELDVKVQYLVSMKEISGQETQSLTNYCKENSSNNQGTNVEIVTLTTENSIGQQYHVQQQIALQSGECLLTKLPNININLKDVKIQAVEPQLSIVNQQKQLAF